MAATVQFDLVSPERKLASAPALSVQVPGMDGDMTALPNHAPLLTTLRPGIVTVAMEKGEEEYVVTGGFAEISPESVTLLAERAVPKVEADAAFIAELRSMMEDAFEAASEEVSKAQAAMRINDVSTLEAQLGL